MSGISDNPVYWGRKLADVERLPGTPQFSGVSDRLARTGSNSLRQSGASSEKTNNSWPVWVFLISLEIPWVFYLGSLRLSAYRLVLLALFVPCAARLISGKAGRIRFADVAILMLALWSAASLAVNHGIAAAAQSAGILFLETVGPYMLARCWIRDENDLRNAIDLLFRIVLILMPFAIIECLGGGNLLLKIFGAVLPVNDYPTVHRLGLTRVISVFDHPILFGLNTGSIVAFTYLVLGYNRSALSRYLKTAIVAATAATSLSAGPIGAIAAQVFLLVWNRLLRRCKHRWMLLIGVLLLFIIVVGIVANRSALSIVTQMIVLDSQTYWYRRLIWEYGSTVALNHPFFGIGMNDWARPSWMPNDTIDNFWLVEAMRFGFAAPVFLLLAGTSTCISMFLKKNIDGRLDDMRTAYLVTLSFLFLIGWTVHFWNSTYVLALFFLGSGVWILDVKPGRGEKAETDADADIIVRSSAWTDRKSWVKGDLIPLRFSSTHEAVEQPLRRTT